MTTEWHYIHYCTRAVGGIGLVMMEATAVERRGRCFITDIGIWSDEHMPGLKRIVDFCHEHDAKVGIQLNHAGRKAIDGVTELIAPSPIRHDANHPVPREMTHEDINEVLKAFRQAARRARELNVDILELHGAHGYLIANFLSPLSNQRTDEYGGSPENRARFAIDVIRAVRQEWVADKPLWIRISVTEYGPDGRAMPELRADMVQVAQQLKKAGVDLIDCSTGGGTPNKPGHQHAGYQVTYSELIRSQVQIPTAAVGKLWVPEVADEVIANGRADLVMVGRELMRNPYWGLEAAHRLGVDVPWPQQYKLAKL